MESESVRRERRMESARGRVHLTSGRARVHTQQFRFLVFLKIVDFLSPTMLAEEEVALGGGVTLKINSKPKLDKVSPAMWVVANTRIMKAMMARPKFCVEQYLTYTEMIGELACRFTWTSVLLFDEEYRQRQAAVGFPWGTEAPHLSTVLLRDRQQGAAGSTQQRRPYSQGPGGHRARPVGATGREICLQFNTRGVCTFGNKCNFEHSCLTCGRDDHPSRDHASAGGLRGGPGTTSGSRGAPTAHSTA